MTETDDRNQPEEPHATNGIDDALPAAPQRTIGLGVDPEQMIRSDTDARIILGLWVIRKGWLPLVVIGITVATIFITTQGRDINELEARIVEVGGGQGLLNALSTPLVLAAFGSLMRIAAFPLAWAVAYPLAHLETKDRHADSNWLGKRLRLTRDRIQLTRGYASIRSTWAVRYAAIDRLDIPDSLLVRSVRLLQWTLIFGLVTYIIVVGSAWGSLE